MKFLLIFLFFISISSCTNPNPEEKNPTDETPTVDSNHVYIKDFYFPLETLTKGKVYEYVVVHEEEVYLSHYWHLKSEQGTNGEQYLIWKRYGPNFEQNQYIKEWIIKDGVITQEYKFLIQDSTTQAVQEYSNEVSQNVVFPFSASLDSVMAYRFVCEMKLPPDFLTVKLIRDRKFNQFIRYTYQEKEVDAITFTSMDLYDIENRKEGGFWKQKRAVVEVYAKGLGLVYTEEKIAGEESTEVTRLSNIYSVEEFEKLKN
ncbi:hypothetical protein [Aureispira anguillae]|uniref:Uncharacterized protein n=1 Tax=Aureispira anguillae TaxID=2864201 RepID=A0A916DVH7_9BACT|nr:hypothetical protein [Aureispira anguillae]BDS14376.1 hypothetical protein AsAng_0051550 [Aureispira anguillae]